MCCSSLMGICSLVNWLQCVQSSRPWSRSGEFEQAMATARPNSVTGPPPGCCCNSSSLSSSTAFLATGFLLTFLMWLASTEMPRCCKAFAFLSKTNPGEGLTHMTVWGPSRKCRPGISWTRASQWVLVHVFYRVQGKAQCIGSSAPDDIGCKWHAYTDWLASELGGRHRCCRNQTCG